MKIIAGFYDPVWFIQPVIVQLKILFQQICVLQVGWDDQLPAEIKTKWTDILDAIRKMDKIVVKRCYCFFDIHNPIISTELHGFSDASMSGYGACVYLRFVMSNGNIKLAFVSSKSRVAPISTKQTIPRLELMCNLIFSRLVVSIMRCLCEEMDISASFCYTDSQISPAWIKGVGKEYKTFIQNRVLEIR